MLNQKFMGAFPERDRCITELLYASGIRAEELANLQLEDLRQVDALAVRGKGKKERLVLFGEMAQDALRVYLAARRRVLKKKRRSSNAVFFGLTADGLEIGSLDVRTIGRIVKQVAQTAVNAPHVPSQESRGVLRLLTVDDDRFVREACWQAAAALGYSAKASDSFDQALWLVESENIDVVFLSAKPADFIAKFHQLKKKALSMSSPSPSDFPR